MQSPCCASFTPSSWCGAACSGRCTQQQQRLKASEAQTENAIHHGLEPKLAGGRIDIQASVEQGLLRIRVQDDGPGLGAPRRAGRRGHGMALANIRARLQTRYGEHARLLLQAAEPGTVALPELPYEAKWAPCPLPSPP